MTQSRQKDLNKILILAGKSADGLCDFYRDEESIILSVMRIEDKQTLSVFENFLRRDLGRLAGSVDSKILIKQALDSLFKTGKWNKIFVGCFIEFISRHPELIDPKDRDKFITESFRMH